MSPNIIKSCLSQNATSGWVLLFLEDFSEPGGSLKIIWRPAVLHIVLRGQAVLFGIQEFSIEDSFHLALLENQRLLILIRLIMIYWIEAIRKGTSTLLDLDILTVLIDGWDICEEVVLLAQVVQEALEGDHHYSQVVKGFLSSCVLHKCVYHASTDLMDCQVALLGICGKTGLAFLNCLPCELLDFKVGKAVKDPIATHDYEILVLIYMWWVCTWFDTFLVRGLKLKLSDLWLGNYHARLACIFFKFSFNVSKSTRDTQSAWEDTERPQNDVLSCRLSANTYILNGLCLIYLSTMLCYSRLLGILIRSVVAGEDE